MLNKNEVGLFLPPYTKMNSTCLVALNVKKAKTIKLLDENIGYYIYGLGENKYFLERTWNTPSIKKVINGASSKFEISVYQKPPLKNEKEKRKIYTQTLCQKNI